ncbi:hypothetical protein H8F24_14690 [Synechococcus sp. CBW1002]|uniref:hypothetical protein n=1 Tax=unclassified Synechococcus TaxID=2626047 RepID=UPI0018CF1FFF|nr:MULTISPECIES: hypothetical protein [unclassified Synechococcus]QPN59278.1 hypothetical protein H8F24_14690 [Synechococcus sp. CBW1002]QPN67135.1 hypothetical protein H8F26_02355 [Synechococcus sp. CBW1006]
MAVGVSGARAYARTGSFADTGGRVVVLQLIPGNELSKLDPAIVTREFAAKRQEEILKRELMTMLAPIHVENSGLLFGDIEPN